jgi:Luciferase-like monooxygenase
MAMRSGLFLPIFDELADPAAVARLSHEAEQAGWHGGFVWDHVRWQPELAVADPWITLAAAATATERARLGPMVTPLARRRPVKVAGRPRRSTGSAVAGSPSGSAWAATSSGASSRSPVKNATSAAGTNAG